MRWFSHELIWRHRIFKYFRLTCFHQINKILIFAWIYFYKYWEMIKKWSKVSYYLVFLFFLSMPKHILLWILLKHAPNHSNPFWPTSTHFHPFPLTLTNSHPLPATSIYSHLFSPTPIYSHPLPHVPTHSRPPPLIFNPFALIFSHSHPLPLSCLVHFY